MPLIDKMRLAFAKGDWKETSALYGKRASEVQSTRSLRLEAACLAVRALIATKQRSEARLILKRVSAGSYKKPVHYEFLAKAYLDMKQYKEAAAACERADHLHRLESEGAATPSIGV